MAWAASGWPPGICATGSPGVGSPRATPRQPPHSQPSEPARAWAAGASKRLGPTGPPPSWAFGVEWPGQQELHGTAHVLRGSCKPALALRKKVQRDPFNLRLISRQRGDPDRGSGRGHGQPPTPPSRLAPLSGRIGIHPDDAPLGGRPMARSTDRRSRAPRGVASCTLARHVTLWLAHASPTHSRWAASPWGGALKRPPPRGLLREGMRSGRRDLNPRRPPWQGGTLPLSYSRKARTQCYLFWWTRQPFSFLFCFFVLLFGPFAADHAFADARLGYRWSHADRPLVSAVVAGSRARHGGLEGFCSCSSETTLTP